MTEFLVVALAIYEFGVFTSLLVFAYRSGGSWRAYIIAFAHLESRRNGIPWVIKSVGKALVWPIILTTWMRSDSPPTRELFGDAAAERLGLREGNAFATRWTSPE